MTLIHIRNYKSWGQHFEYGGDPGDNQAVFRSFHKRTAGAFPKPVYRREDDKSQSRFVKEEHLAARAVDDKINSFDRL